MYNSCGGRKTPLMGFNVTQSWCPTMTRGLHNHMDHKTSYMDKLFAFSPPPLGANKSFTNPNFVNEKNPSLLRHPSDIYHPPPVTKPNNNHQQQKSPVEPPQEMKKKRKRKRRNRKRNKKTSGGGVKTEENTMPELTNYFKSFTMQAPLEVENMARAALRTRVPSICESEDSFIVFEDGADEDVESSIESDGVVVVEESTEVSDNEEMSSDCSTPRKKVSVFYCFYWATTVGSECLFCPFKLTRDNQKIQNKQVIFVYTVGSACFVC